MDIEQLAGAKLGNYKIESLLGRGGMGVVYKARQISLNRLVALKILSPTLSSDPSYVKRFQREAEAVAQLSHENILHIYDVGGEKDLSFFSMEYIGGRTLDEVIETTGHLDADEAVKIIVQAAQGIEHAHENRILHRDIKPSNIILDKRGHVKVMDFGLARIIGEGSKLTQSGTLMGTLDYMSPEQCKGEELDEQTDIYSLGVVLYEMLTGSVPFDAPNEAALIHKIISQEATQAKELDPSIPDDLNAIVSRAISKDRDERYAGISEVLENIRDFQSSQSSVVIAQEEPSPSIAVLPFADMSPEKDQEYFCDGLAEELINALTQIKDLHVVARTSAFSFKDQNIDVRDIGKRLNVETVLEGSVRKAGNRLRITCQLVKVSDGYHLWSDKFDREMEDIFAIQDEISQAIVDKLKPRLLPEERKKLAERQTVDLEAYNLCLKGRYFWNKHSEDGFRKAIAYFEQAIEKDPGCAMAYVGLADCYFFLPYYGFSTREEAYPRLKEAALKAVEIDSTLADACSTLGDVKVFYEWDWESGESLFKRAIELNPGYAHVHNALAMLLLCLGRNDEAIEEARQALELDPLSIMINREAGMILAFSGKYDEAIDALTKTIEMDPKIINAHSVLGFAYLGKLMYEEALNEFKEEMEVSKGQSPRAESYAGLTYALMDRKDEARAMLEDLLRKSEREHISAVALAFLHLALGEKQKGFELLEKGYEERDPLMCFVKVFPVFRLLNLCSDPGYIALLKKMKLDK